MTDPVARRLVLHVAGYDPMSAEAAHRRFARELGRFRTTWKVEAECSDVRLSDDVATWSVQTRGRDWSVATEVWWLRWDDVMARLTDQPVPKRIAGGVAAFADFAIFGAFTAYVRHNWRYAIFFAYPVLLLVLCMSLAAIAGYVVATLAGGPLGLVLGAAVLIALLALARRRARLDHMLDDWIFARHHIRWPDAALSARLDRLAGKLVEATGRPDVDEVLLIGHSLGAVLAVEIVDRALMQNPQLGSAGPTLSLATVGSSIPKLGFHRDARALREALGRVGSARSVCWVDYQAYVDVLNFHKLHPVRGLGAGARGPLIRSVPMRKVLHPAYYRKIRSNLLRVHNQFVSANDVRSSYDYFMLVCGPCRLDDQSTALDGAAACVDAEGARVRSAKQRFVPRPGLGRDA